MSTKKPGFFKRLFGGDEGRDAQNSHEGEALEKTVEPGPPEASPEWVEGGHPDKADPAVAVPTPDVEVSGEPGPVSPGPPEASIVPGGDGAEILSGEGGGSVVGTSGSVPEPEPEPEPAKKVGWFRRLTSGLKKTSDRLSENIGAVFTQRKLDDSTLEELEDVLIQADLGVDMATTITRALAQDRFDKQISTGEVRQVLAREVEKVLAPVAVPFSLADASGTVASPHVILMVGVNGSGKTTTIGKLAEKFTAQGKKVLLAAGDTFRAAAIEQLVIWGERTGCEVIRRPAGSDASGLAYDAMVTAREGGHDVLIIDTAGRLQNRDELMAELEKIIRVIRKVDADAPHSVLLTLDATTGQNALQQVEIFGKRAGVTGLVMTKLDGTARGGILVAIASRFSLPVHFIGVGEAVDDLEPFNARDFAAAIAGEENE